MTYKAWLLYMIQVNHDADIACAKALRHLLQVKMYFGLFFYLKPKPFGNSFWNSETVPKQFVPFIFWKFLSPNG